MSFCSAAAPEPPNTFPKLSVVVFEVVSQYKSSSRGDLDQFSWRFNTKESAAVFVGPTGGRLLNGHARDLEVFIQTCLLYVEILF